jgi:hypothetical protein
MRVYDIAMYHIIVAAFLALVGFVLLVVSYYDGNKAPSDTPAPSGLNGVTLNDYAPNLSSPTSHDNGNGPASPATGNDTGTTTDGIQLERVSYEVLFALTPPAWIIDCVV